MRIILLSFILLLLFASPALATQETFEYLSGDTWSNYWTLYPTQAAPNAISAELYINTTTNSTELYIQNHWSNTYQSIILNKPQNLGYVSYILQNHGGTGQPDNNRHHFTIFNAAKTAVLDFPMYLVPNNVKIEIIPNGNYIDYYVNGDLKESKVNPGITSTDTIYYGFRLYGGDRPYIQIDDFTTEGSIIGTKLLFTESVNTFHVTWSAQLMRSYPDSQFNLSLYSISNPDNAGLIHTWSLPSEDNASSTEYGYFSMNRSNLLHLNYGLYMLV